MKITYEAIDSSTTKLRGKKLSELPDGIYWSKSGDSICVKINDKISFSSNSQGVRFAATADFWPEDFVPYNGKITLTFSND